MGPAVAALAAAVWATAALALPAGCGGDDPAPGDDPAGTEAAPVPPPADGIVTEADDGASFELAEGETVMVRLASEWAWDEPTVADGAVALARVDYLVDPGFREWEVAAVAAGTAELSFRGEPNCADPADCPPRTVRLRFVVPG